MDKFDITKAYSAKADALAGKIQGQREEENKGKSEGARQNGKRKKK